MNYGISNENGTPKLDEIKEIIKSSSDENICFFDTAQDYGNSEFILGKVFSDLKIENKVKVITKFSHNLTPKDYENSIKSSLKKLRIKKLWGIMLHRYESSLFDNFFFELISEFKSKNYIDNFGVSIYDPEDAISLVNNPNIDIIQVPFNLFDRRLVDNNFFEIAKKTNKKIFIRSIYLQGLFLLNNETLKKKNMQWAIPHLSFLHDFIKNHNLKLKEFIFESLNKYISECFLISGINSVVELEENFKLFNSQIIDKKLIDKWWKELPLMPTKLLNPAMW